MRGIPMPSSRATLVWRCCFPARRLAMISQYCSLGRPVTCAAVCFAYLSSVSLPGRWSAVHHMAELWTGLWTLYKLLEVVVHIMEGHGKSTCTDMGP